MPEDMIDYSRLTILNYRDGLGSLDKLCESIKEDGLHMPVLVSPGMTVLSGERRIAALRRLGKTMIPYIVVDSIEDVCLRMLVERDGKHTWSMRPSESAAQMDAILTAGLIPPMELGRARKSSSLVALAPAFNKGVHYLAKLLIVYRTAHRGWDEEDRSAGYAGLHSIDDGVGVIAVGDELAVTLTKKYPDKPKFWYGYTEMVEEKEPEKSVMTPAQQRAAIAKTMATLSGIRSALKTIGPLGKGFPQTDALEYLSEIKGLRAALTGLENKLKGAAYE